MPKLENMTGQRFGRLTVIGRVQRQYRHKVVYDCVCECDCGEVCFVHPQNLKRGKQKSCGCFRNELLVNASIDGFKFVEGTSLTMIKSTKPNKNSTSGVRGVTFHKGSKKWRAQIGFQGKCISLGLFDTIEQAAMARRIAEDDLYKPMLEKHGET